MYSNLSSKLIQGQYFRCFWFSLMQSVFTFLHRSTRSSNPNWTSHIHISSAYPHLIFRYIFRPSWQILAFFPFKNRTLFEMRFYVVYKFKFNAGVHCMSTKQGDIFSHESQSTWKFRLKSGKTHSVVYVGYSSSSTAHHHVSPSDFSILSSGSCIYELDLRESPFISKLKRESLFISKPKPSLNNSISSIPL